MRLVWRKKSCVKDTSQDLLPGIPTHLSGARLAQREIPARDLPSRDYRNYFSLLIFLCRFPGSAAAA